MAFPEDRNARPRQSPFFPFFLRRFIARFFMLGVVMSWVVLSKAYDRMRPSQAEGPGGPRGRGGTGGPRMGGGGLESPDASERTAMAFLVATYEDRY